MGIVKRAAVGLVCAFVVVAFGGCGPKAGDVTKEPKAAVSNAVSAVKSVDFENAKKYIDLSGIVGDVNAEQEIEKNKEFIGLLFSKLDYKIISADVKGDNAVVNADISNADLKAVFNRYIAQYPEVSIAKAISGNFEDFDVSYQKISSLINATDIQIVTKNLDIKLTKIADTWVITLDDALQDAMLGGLVTGIKEEYEKKSR